MRRHSHLLIFFALHLSYHDKLDWLDFFLLF